MTDDNGADFTVDYLITKSSHKLKDGSTCYGIRVQKSPAADESSNYEALGCFTNESNARLLIEKLYEHTVTPAGAEEVVDILLDKCPFEY